MYTHCMRKTAILVTMLSLFGLLAMAQDEAQYKMWMKSIPPQMGAIRNAADTSAAAAPANNLADTFGMVVAFWKARNADDAVQLAQTAQDAAKAIASGSGDKAANLMKIQGTCGACHAAHRAGAAPNFTIK